MHGSVPGDPMWLVSEHGDNQSIDVIKMTGELTSSPSFTYTNLAVTPYSAVVPPINPDGTTVTMPGLRHQEGGGGQRHPGGRPGRIGLLDAGRHPVVRDQRRER